MYDSGLWVSLRSTHRPNSPSPHFPSVGSRRLGYAPVAPAPLDIPGNLKTSLVAKKHHSEKLT
jgi:hypothetical protein